MTLCRSSLSSQALCAFQTVGCLCVAFWLQTVLIQVLCEKAKLTLVVCHNFKTKGTTNFHNRFCAQAAWAQAEGELLSSWTCSSSNSSRL